MPDTTFAAETRLAGIPRALPFVTGPGSVTGTTTETTLATFTIPANAMGANGFVEIQFAPTWTNSANAKIINIRLNGVMFWFAQQTTNSGLRAVVTVFNTNSATAQIGPAQTPNGLGVITAPSPTIGAINTAADVAVTITGTLASAADTISLQAASCRVTYVP